MKQLHSGININRWSMIQQEIKVRFHIANRKEETVFHVWPPAGAAETGRHPRLAYVASPFKRVKDGGRDSSRRQTGTRTDRQDDMEEAKQKT